MKETAKEREILNQYRSLDLEHKKLFISILRQLQLINSDIFNDDTNCHSANQTQNVITISHATINGNHNTFINNVVGSIN